MSARYLLNRLNGVNVKDPPVAAGNTGRRAISTPCSHQPWTWPPPSWHPSLVAYRSSRSVSCRKKRAIAYTAPVAVLTFKVIEDRWIVSHLNGRMRFSVSPKKLHDISRCWPGPQWRRPTFIRATHISVTNQHLWILIIRLRHVDKATVTSQTLGA